MCCKFGRPATSSTSARSSMPTKAPCRRLARKSERSLCCKFGQPATSSSISTKALCRRLARKSERSLCCKFGQPATSSSMPTKALCRRPLCNRQGRCVANEGSPQRSTHTHTYTHKHWRIQPVLKMNVADLPANLKVNVLQIWAVRQRSSHTHTYTSTGEFNQY